MGVQRGAQAGEEDMVKRGRKVKYLGLVSLLAVLVVVMVLVLAFPAQADRPTFSINITSIRNNIVYAKNNSFNQSKRRSGQDYLRN